MMKSSDMTRISAAEALLRRLKDVGVDYLFANAGTDFPSIIEAYAQARPGADMPLPLAITHEAVAMGMAHGCYLAAGRAQAVMVHVNVGLANALMGLINAASDNVPVMLLSGRTPVTEQGRSGSRTTPIHWGQEMRDQAGMIRELVKWDYELRYPEQTTAAVDRAWAIAHSEPRGPVYLSLPREPLSEAIEAIPAGAPPSPPKPGAPDREALDAAAALLAGARRPLLIAHRGTGARGFEPLAGFAERHAIPVVEFWPTRNSLSTEHPMHVGRDPGPWLAEADLVIVLDARVPWIPQGTSLADGCKVIGIGPDPLFSTTPMRGFDADVCLAGAADQALIALSQTLASGMPPGDALAQRRQEIARRRGEAGAALQARARSGRGAPMTAGWASLCLSEAKDADAMLFNELGVEPAVMSFSQPSTLFCNPLSGGLGWAMSAALGAQLAAPERQVIACMGDGSYIFANPVACHQTAAALGLPILTVVFNNGVWNAVRRATLAMYPDGAAARANVMPLTSLGPPPDYCAVAAAHGAFAQRVEHGDALPDAIARAFDVIRRERRQAFLDVLVSY
jgi:acetolactate synthase-1/2/3 large subunit